MADGNVFDSVFKTMLHKAPSLFVPLVNEAFGRGYAAEEPVRRLGTERPGAAGSTIADSVFEIGGRVYHVECQSTPDSAMAVRMLEYDLAIALEGARGAGPPYELDLPESCVLYLRGAAAPEALEVRVNLPGGESFAYAAKAVDAQSFSEDELFDKGLLVLLPYRIMRHEGELSGIAGDAALSEGLVAECGRLRARLQAATLGGGKTPLYEDLVDLIIRVSDYVLAPHGALKKEVRRAMGGEVLELMSDRVELMSERVERAEREAREAREAERRSMQRGMQRGMERGMQRGIEQGLERGVDDLSAVLAERGVDAALLEEAAAIVREAQKS